MHLQNLHCHMIYIYRFTYLRICAPPQPTTPIKWYVRTETRTLSGIVRGGGGIVGGGGGGCWRTENWDHICLSGLSVRDVRMYICICICICTYHIYIYIFIYIYMYK